MPTRRRPRRRRDRESTVGAPLTRTRKGRGRRAREAGYGWTQDARGQDIPPGASFPPSTYYTDGTWSDPNGWERHRKIRPPGMPEIITLIDDGKAHHELRVDRLEKRLREMAQEAKLQIKRSLPQAYRVRMGKQRAFQEARSKIGQRLPGMKQAREKKARQKVTARVLLHRLQDRDHKLAFRHVAISLLFQRVGEKDGDKSCRSGPDMEARDPKAKGAGETRAEGQPQLDQRCEQGGGDGGSRRLSGGFLRYKARNQTSRRGFLWLHPWLVPPWGKPDLESGAAKGEDHRQMF